MKKKEEELYKKNFVVLLNYYYKNNPEMYKKLSDEYNHRMHNYIMNKIKLPAILDEKIKYAAEYINKNKNETEHSDKMEQLKRIKSKASSFGSKQSFFTRKPTLLLRSFDNESKKSISSQEGEQNYEISQQEIIWISERNLVTENVLNSFINYLNEKIKSEQNRNSNFSIYSTIIMPTYFYKEITNRKKKYTGILNQLGEEILPTKYEKIKDNYQYIIVCLSLGANEFLTIFFNFIKFEIIVLDCSNNNKNEIEFYQSYIQNITDFLDINKKIRFLEQKNSTKFKKSVGKTFQIKDFKESGLFACYFIYKIVTNEMNFNVQI